MMDIKINNEMDYLQVVMVGIADDFGGTPNLNNCYDPKSKENLKKGTFPVQKDVIREINSLIKIFEKYNVKVFRPENIKRLNQIFLEEKSIELIFIMMVKLILLIIKHQGRKKQRVKAEKICNYCIIHICYLKLK